MRLSVIIPTLNEAQYLAGTHKSERSLEQVIIKSWLPIDSRDGTREVATHLALPVVSVPPPHSRAKALNTGASFAEGDVLLFLDADTRVPVGFDVAIEKVLHGPDVVGGAFE